MPNASRDTAAGRVLLLTASAALSVGPAYATNFDISNGSTAAQTLGPTSGQTGTVEGTGSLTVTGGTVAVTITGANATLTNLGTINQTGTGRVVRDNTGVAGLTITNGSATNSTALMQAADADVVQMAKPASVTLNNYGTMTSLNASKGGAQAVDFAGITSGGNVLNNYATGVIQARDADSVRPGTNGIVNNYGKIIATNTTDLSDDGVDVQNNTGVTVNNFAGGSISAARHGITGGPDSDTVFTTLINNSLGANITGNNGAGVNLDGFSAKQTATIVNNGTITGNGLTGDGDGIDVDGVINLTNTGTIRSLNSFSSGAVAQSEGVTIGGGSITNSGIIEGDVSAGNTNAVGRGITIAGVDTSGTAQPIYANTTITNQSGGLIKGKTDSAIAVGGTASGFTVNIINASGGTIVGGGTTAAAIKTGADADVITNSGTINGASSGKAIDMGAGNNSLTITGGTASLIGDVNGGVGGTNQMSINPGSGNSFAYAGSLANFASVTVGTGTTTLSGSSTYTGTTTVTGGGKLVLDGANRLSSSGGLVLNGATLELANAGGANGQTFGFFSLTDNSTLDLGQSSLTFNGLSQITAGKSLTVIDWSSAASPGYAFRFLGDDTTNAAFLTLIDGTTINGLEAIFHFDGTYTDVSAVPLPETWTMLISGMGLLGACRYRRRFGIQCIANG